MATPDRQRVVVLPPDTIAEGVRRLGWIALVYAIGYITGPLTRLVCRLGPDDDFVKVLDFGLVKHTHDGQTVTGLSTEGGAMGTPGYMAPEIALGRGDVDARSDIYSLGCVAYYMLTGRPVFSGDTPVATAVAHVQDAPVPPRLRSEFTLPPALDALILECLAKDPDARPASATVVSERLMATVSVDPWTPDAARCWWERQQPLNRSQATAAATVQDATVTLIDRPRCRPRLEGRPLASLSRG